MLYYRETYLDFYVMSIRTDFKENKWVVSAFWLAVIVFLGVCAYFMIHNAYWRIGDEAIVIAHTGMGKPFSPLGFDAMLGYGRLYPFAYNLYNILLLFHDGYISPTDHYVLQSVALVIYALAFVAIALHLLKGKPVVWKYAIAFCFMAVCVARVYSEFYFELNEEKEDFSSIAPPTQKEMQQPTCDAVSLEGSPVS